MAAQLKASSGQAASAVEVFAPARLHFGFLDLNGSLGRRFGSVGLTLDGIGTRLALRVDPHATITGPSAGRTRHYLHLLSERMGIDLPISVTLFEAIPEHIGLGSGTQLGLALAAGLAILDNRPRDARSLSDLVERGARSGIGIGSFELGGFLVDGGRGPLEGPAPIIVRTDFPKAWRIILIFDATRRGISGQTELSAFAALSPFPSELAAHLCHTVLMRLLPGLAEEDFTAVASSLGEIQDRVGDHFAPVQGGRYSSPRVTAVLEWLRSRGLSGVGQSSWGPTGFVLVEDEARAGTLIAELERRFADIALSFRLCTARNEGATIHTRTR
jgi:beta-RFAP synthase